MKVFNLGILILGISFLFITFVTSYVPPAYNNITSTLESDYTPDDYYNNTLTLQEEGEEGAGMCSPSLNQDWEITDTQTCDANEVTTGTGSIIIKTGGKLYLINGANVTTNKLELQTTGDQIFINEGGELRII